MHTAAKTKTVTIAGRAYKPIIDSTLEHDTWTMLQLRLCGLETVGMEEGENAEAFAHRIFMRAAENGNVFDLLGGLLMPVSVKPENWTPQLAAETGRSFADVCSAEDKATVRGQIAEALMGFFARGLSCIRTFPKSSNREETKPLTSHATGEHSTTEHGHHSSANSEETILHTCTGSCDGQCGKPCSHT